VSDLRIGIVGAGRIARVHADAYRRVTGGGLVACVDVVPEAAERFAAEVGLEVEPTLDALLAREDVDAVLIASPNSAHADQAVAALDAGKHVFCQKPISLTLADADRVVERAGGADRVVQLGFMLRFLPPISALRERLANGGVGRVIASRAAVFGWEPSADWFYDPSLGGGVILDTLVHFADLAQWLLGPVEKVYADGGAFVLDGARRHGSPDNATVQLRHAGGAVSSFYATWTAGHGDFTFEVYGDRGAESIDLVGNGDGVWPTAYAGEQQHFVDRIRGAAALEPAADAAAARDALALALAMQASLDEERVVVLS
jgi:myo-inositol 2-dehydrogenase/D-chiro-inositol 1-dehydrogenase